MSIWAAVAIRSGYGRCVNCGEVTEPGIVMNRSTAADLITATVPQARGDGTVADVMKLLQSRTWVEVGHVYLVDNASRLVGQVPN